MLSARYTGSIYIAINRVNGRAYIGKTIGTLVRRKATHRFAAKSRGGAFYAAIRKYGWRAFVWRKLFQSDCEKTLFQAERELIADFRASGLRLYNLSTGGEGQSLPCTEERRRKLSAITTGRKLSPEHVEKIRTRMKGNRLPEASIERMRQSKIGRKLAPWSEERRQKHKATWEAKRAAGYKRTPAQVQKMREATKPARQTEETRRKLREAGRKGAAARWGT